MNKQKLLESIFVNEAYRGYPYRDSEGLWTFALGRCLETNPLKAYEWKHLLDYQLITVTINPEGAQWLRDREIQTAIDVLQSGRFFDVQIWNEMSDARRNVLIEMVYQMGVEHLAQFKQMLAAIRRHNWVEAAREGLDSHWAKIDSPERAKRLMNQLERGVFV